MIYRKYFINVKILIKSFLVILVISFSSLTLAASPDCQYIPKRIILNITENPAVSQIGCMAYRRTDNKSAGANFNSD